MQIEPTADTANAWTFSKAEWAALCAFASKDESRLPCHGVALNAERAMATATDGHRAVAITPPLGVASTTTNKAPTILVAYTDAKAILKACPAGGSIRIATNCTAVHVQLFDRKGNAALSASYQIPDHKPAPVWTIVDNQDWTGANTGGAVGIDLYYLSDMKLLADALDHRHGAFTMRVNGQLDPVLFSGRSVTCEIKAVIMPFRL